MNLKKLTQEELELMSYDDLAYALLSENQHQMKIIDLFKEIGKLINLPESTIEEKIGDFFEILTLDKRFIMLDDGSWDLKDRHVQDIIIEEDEEEINLDEVEENEETKEEEIFFDEDQDDNDDNSDDLKDLVIIEEDEEESNF